MESCHGKIRCQVVVSSSAENYFHPASEPAGLFESGSLAWIEIAGQILTLSGV
jgi:hypothetical protein